MEDAVKPDVTKALEGLGLVGKEDGSAVLKGRDVGFEGPLETRCAGRAKDGVPKVREGNDGGGRAGRFEPAKHPGDVGATVTALFGSLVRGEACFEGRASVKDCSGPHQTPEAGGELERPHFIGVFRRRMLQDPDKEVG